MNLLTVTHSKADCLNTLVLPSWIRVAFVAASLTACRAVPNAVDNSFQKSEENIAVKVDTTIDCEARYEDLCNEKAEARRAWSGYCKRAMGTDQYENLSAQWPQIEKSFLARFQELERTGCLRATVDILESMAYLQLSTPEDVTYATELLTKAISQGSCQEWIYDIADNDIIRYFLGTSQAQYVLDLFRAYTRESHTSDLLFSDEVSCRALYELSFALIKNEDLKYQQAAFDFRREVLKRWPDSQEAQGDCILSM